MNFMKKYLIVLGILLFGFLGGVLFIKKDHVPQEQLQTCNEDKSELVNSVNECREKFIQCVVYLGSIIDKKGKK